MCSHKLQKYQSALWLKLKQNNPAFVKCQQICMGNICCYIQLKKIGIVLTCKNGEVRWKFKPPVWIVIGQYSDVDRVE